MNQASNAVNSNPESPVRELDELFLNMTRDLCDAINHTASDAALQIIDLSSNFLSQQTQQLLVEFHKLYSDNPELAKFKNKINLDVDNIIDAVAQNIDPTESGNASTPDFQDDSSLNDTCAGLAAIQRDLENQINMDERVRKHVLPVLESMQFEETLARSLSQTNSLWKTVISSMEQPSSQAIDDINQKILSTLTSKDERELFYKTVLQKEFDEDHLQNHEI